MLAQYARNPIVKNYLYRMEERNKPLNVEKWYHVNVNALPVHVRSKFIQSEFDEETSAFLDNCYEKSDWLFTQIFHGMLRTLFTWFMSMTTVNGLLNRGSMYVFSQEQFETLLDIDEKWKGDKLLDLGAGDGKVTQNILPYFNEAYATEQSPTMRWRLQEKGFKVMEIEEWPKSKNYSVITALNLLDRIDEPVQLMKDIHVSLSDDGHVILAIVLPYNPCYETGTTFGPPKETLPICGRTIEEQVRSLHDDVFIPMGFDVIKFTRLPYLCEGDLHTDFFVLTDLVFVLKKANVDNVDVLQPPDVCLVSKSL